MTRYRTLAGALLVIASLGGGCGGDDDDAQSLSKDDFLEQANAVCEEGTVELDEAFEDAFASGEPSPDEVEALMKDTVIPNIHGQIDDIRDLGAPDEIDGGVESFLDAASARLDELEAMDADELFETMTSGENPFAEVNAMASNLGLTSCADEEE
jgi:hypothetical protein